MRKNEKKSIFSKPPNLPILSSWILNLHIIMCQFQKRSTKKHFFSLSPCSCHMCTPQYQSRTNLSLVRLSSTSSSQHASCEDQLRRKMLEKIIRVDHAGEMWASFIYQGNYSAIREFCLRSLFLKACDLYFHSFSFRSNGSFKEYKVARPHPGDVGS